MKKTRFVIIGLGAALLCAVLLFGAFAPHSTDMINASGGQIDIDITNAEIGYVSEYIEISQSSVVVKNDNKTVEIGVHNLYSSSEANVSIEITNTGVLPIKFIWIRQDVDNVVDMESEKDVDVNLLKDLNIQYDLLRLTNDMYEQKESQTISVSEGSMRTLEGSEVIIQQGESIRLDVKIMVKSDSGTNIENKSFVFSITPFFTQAF
ncbi:hypothetical protein SDC9_118370 [bioreactor metagenome]|uniref:Uncharacterized protein n=1 Tax=bioreactor metagenome TaxID=1076179 RepID=A0A645C1J5_9ZZZZ